MPYKLVWLSVFAVTLSFAVPSSQAGITGEQALLQQEVAEASARFGNVCRVAWGHDNLRPTPLRAIAPVGTPFRPAQVPVVFLSPGSSDYRKVVGEMMYWYSLLGFRKQRLAEFATWPKGSVTDENLGEEIRRVQNEFDNARAKYRKACAWAWPYSNLRPLCHKPGFEPATIPNPFLPVPTIPLSQANPDYVVIVASLEVWEPRIGMAQARWGDLRDDRKAAAAAADAVAAVGPQRKLAAEKALSENRRLAKMLDLYRQMKPALRKWRANQHQIESLGQTRDVASSDLMALHGQGTSLPVQIYSDGNDLATVKRELAVIDRKIAELQAEQAMLAGQIDGSTEEWVHLCDVLGRLSPTAHYRALPLFDQWIAEEPRLWQPYLARGAARMHVCQCTLALSDLKRVESKLRLYDSSRLRLLAFVTAVQAYAVCKQNDPGQGNRLFADAKNLDTQSWEPYFVYGWGCLERRAYSEARADFKRALQLSKNKPEPEVLEAMALLLATCPDERLRDGKQAVEYAAKACSLTSERDWVCLDTLGAAQAEAGDFGSAVKSANRALKLAPADSQELIGERIEFYRAKVPYRLR